LYHRPVPDEQNRRLLSHVRPPAWRNPAPASTYDLVVLGGGTAGLVCAAGAAGLGARVAIVERARLGGDCLNTGCVPSKALLRSARVVGEARKGAPVGVTAAAAPEFAAVMHRLRARRADVAPNDSAARLASLGVDVFFGCGRFTSRRTVSVSHAPHDPDDHGAPDDANATAVLRFRKAVIATGSGPAVPAVPGLADVPYLTNETVFELTRQPGSLIVLGGGPVGCELAQAFARLGTQVTLVEANARLLPREEADAAALVAAQLERDGVTLRLHARTERVWRAEGRVGVKIAGADLVADALLVAAGRSPRTEDLGLEAAGVAIGVEGVEVNDRLQTRNRRIYASGDVCSAFKFTHAADAMSRIVVQNALFHGRRRASALVIPWCTFTDPEVAHAGVSAEDAPGRRLETITIPLADVDRAVVDDETGGFVRFHHERGRIRGATIVGPHAGELIATVALAMQHGLGLADLAGMVFPYPTLSLALRQAGDAFRRSSLTPGVRRALGYYFRWSP
jgi:pyruvate/2-oxoglutarate dehydrogenase complex dihydrolipoamide dehydrogenase (E3) component